MANSDEVSDKNFDTLHRWSKRRTVHFVVDLCGCSTGQGFWQLRLIFLMSFLMLALKHTPPLEFSGLEVAPDKGSVGGAFTD